MHHTEWQFWASLLVLKKNLQFFLNYYIGDIKLLLILKIHYGGFPGSSVVKNLLASAGDMGLIPDLGDPTCRGATKAVHYWSLPPREARMLQLESN